MRTALLLLIGVVFVAADAADDRLRDSWIHIDESVCTQTVVEGQSFEVAVEYHLAPGRSATLSLNGHGPWVDLPDGKYEKDRRHLFYPGMSAQLKVEPGRGRHVFTFTMPKPYGRDTLLWIAAFSDDGQGWPWEVRESSGRILPADPSIRLTAATPGNLFTYAEPVRFSVAFGKAAAPRGDAEVTWTVLGRDGTTVDTGTAKLKGPVADLEIPCERRGVFGLRVERADGQGAAETTFARIPDVMALTKGEPTRFGMHALLATASDEVHDSRMRAARRLGLTFCRNFTSWQNLQPGRDEWRLEGLDRSLTKAKEHGIGTMICLVNPPAWVMTRSYSAGFAPFGFDEAAWTTSITTMGKRFKGRLAAWEWLNEIVPGQEPDPIATYLAMVRLGNAAAKAQDPKVLSVLAGGLWPRNFRLGLLAAGIGEHIDVLPIHYGSGAGILEAATDLAAVSANKVQVWDDETATGVSTWGMPNAEAIARTEQRNHAMSQFPGELTAGAERILWFGFGGDAAGNWDYHWIDGSPRPVAATLAMLATKLHRAKPQGSFAIGDSGAFNLFAVDGKAVLVAPASTAAQRVRVGSAALLLTDDQGEESKLAAKALDAELPPAALPFFVEGGDLDVLRGYTAPQLVARQFSLLAGGDMQLRVRVTNRSAKKLACELTTSLPDGWPAARAMPVTIAAGGSELVEIPISAPDATTAGEFRLSMTCTYSDARLPLVQLPWQLSVIDPKNLGNLLVNGDLEQEGGWNMDPASAVVTNTDNIESFGQRSLRMGPSEGWQFASLTHFPTLVPGRSYLYSAWVRIGAGKDAGSNIYQKLQSGAEVPMYIPQVFTAAQSSDWQFLTKLYVAPGDLASASFVPVAMGMSDAQYDNLRLTVYESSNFAAEAHRVATAPSVDGDLSEWTGACPIPLLGPGQTTILDPAWKEGSANLRGVAKLAWDDQNLYVAAWIDDDALDAPHTGDRTIESDSLVIGLHPANRAPDTDAKAFCYYLSPVSPGGGSGQTTLFRPAEHSGGLSSGQLAKDSSVYELAIRRSGTRTLYEARLPWSELGTSGRLGGKLGLSLQLNDNDGNGRAAIISWGDGLAPAWNPALFGVLTLVE